MVAPGAVLLGLLGLEAVVAVTQVVVVHGPPPEPAQECTTHPAARSGKNRVTHPASVQLVGLWAASLHGSELSWRRPTRTRGRTRSPRRGGRACGTPAGW